MVRRPSFIVHPSASRLRRGVDLRDIGEFGLLRRITNWMAHRNPTVVRGIGDDVAVLKVHPKDGKCLLATTDLLIEDVDFKKRWADPLRLGRKALAVNLSDIAAMGGTPTYYLLSLGLPRLTPLSFISSFYRGLKEAESRYGVFLIGGDLSRSEKIIINICLLGEGKEKDLIFRNGAKPGDDLFVSGTLGDSALGLAILQKKGLRASPRALIERHLAPRPRMELGRALSQGRLATAMIDVSDGLLLDVSHLLESSRAGVRIWEEHIPLSSSYRKNIHAYSKGLYTLALSGGEDFELLFTAAPEKRERVLSLSAEFKIPITWIGRILPLKEGFHIVGSSGEDYSPSHLGFEHFK